jgi:hypothetical protein
MLANSLAVEAMLDLDAGVYDTSLAASDEGYQLSAAIGNAWGMAFNRNTSSLIHWDRGNAARAIAVGRDVIEQARRSGFIIPSFSTAIVLAEIYADLGALSEASALLAGVRQQQGPIARMYQPTLRAMEIRVCLLKGQAAEARSLADVQAGLLAEVPSYYVRGTGYYLVGLAAIVQSELGLLRGEPDRVVALTEHMEAEAWRIYRRGLAEILYWRARAQQAAGNSEAAGATLHRARQQAETIGHPRALWPILALQAESAAQAGDNAQADALLVQARSIIALIADHAGSPELRAAFLARPAVRSVLT